MNLSLLAFHAVQQLVVLAVGSEDHRPLTSHTAPTGHAVFRLIYNTSRIGELIGKSGCIVKKIQQETASKIIVEDYVSETDEQVIVVIASSSVNMTLLINSARGGDIGIHVDLSVAHKAIIRVFERILEVAADMDGFSVASRSLVSFRLLVETSHASSVIGKGGKTVTKIRQYTCCRINVLSHDKSPPCAFPYEETIELCLRTLFIDLPICSSPESAPASAPSILSPSSPGSAKSEGNSNSMKGIWYRAVCGMVLFLIWVVLN